MKEIINQKFGKLVPIRYVGKNKNNQYLFLCECDCGNTKIVIKNNLITGNTKSCGCITKERNNNFKHGYTKDKISKTYKSWQDMKQRCNNPKNKDYKNYGGRIPPIKVCKRWSNKKNGFINFLKDIGKIPENKELDRINNNKGYNLKNCKLSTRKEQLRNTRRNHIISYNGKYQCLTDIAKENNMSSETLRYRLNKGMSIKEALTTPIKERKRNI